MKVIVDNQIARKLVHNPIPIIEGPSLSNQDVSISFKWPPLLEYLEIGSLFSEIPPFDKANLIFEACISILHATEEAEPLFHMYDRLFVENLNQIKDLPQINASFILEKIKEQRSKPSFLLTEKMLYPALSAYEAALKEEPAQTMHDLILYLAWDRMCVCMAHIFNHQSSDATFIKSIDILKKCLIESYQHIAQQGHTSPGFFRMAQALLFYQMRQENIEKHSEAEWAILSQSFPVLKTDNELIDFFYIDDALIPEDNREKFDSSTEHYLTLDPPHVIDSRLDLAQCMLAKLKAQIPQWNYILLPTKIIFSVCE